jgi:putative membrane protein
MKQYLHTLFKGIAMGAANVVPGVSGGTIALITGIFERLIDAIKSFNLKAAKLLLSFKFKEFAEYTDLYFLIALFSGIFIAIITLAKLFDFLFTNYPVYIWSYFFGLVLASVYFVGKTISKWSWSVILTFLVGTSVAIIISVLNPAKEDSGFIYLMLCGVVAMCSMILPGLSGSFVLILMGNYQLVMIDAVNNMDFGILIPVGVGAVVGLIAFSHILSWVFKRYRDQTISLLTGFILGSVSILWPWQKAIYLKDAAGELILKKGEPIVEHYSRFLPESFDQQVIFAIIFAILGIATIWGVEKAAEKTD